MCSLFPKFDNPFSEDIFPSIQPKPLLVQLDAVSSCPIICYVRKETDTHLTEPPFRQLYRGLRPPLSLLFLHTKPPQFPQPLLVRLVL